MTSEKKRLQALQKYDILDTPEEEDFNNLAKLASHICGTSAAQINFIDKNRQWSKANVGWGEKEVLLAEIHHRVKNNLAVISGLIQFETMEQQGAEVDRKLLNTLLRIQSMAQVHETMYQTNNFTHVVFEEVIEKIADNIRNTIRSDGDVSLIYDAGEVTLNVNQAIPCGMLINELLTNAWKYAYPEGEKGKIYLEMSEDNGTIVLRITEYGEGLPEDEGPGISHTVGFTLIDQLCTQLKADLEVNRTSGTEYIIQFEKREIKGSSSAL